MPSFSHSVELPKPPAVVFPWLLEEDKVPRWTSDLRSYSVNGPIALGTTAQQILDLAGGLRLELQITVYEPPHEAETQFETNGVKVVSAYSLVAVGGDATKLTQTLDAKASGFAARMLIPVVQGRLEQKLTEDLERLRGLLA